MSLKFTDNRLWLKGIGCAYLRDPATGDVVYYSNKFSTGQVTPSADNGEIAAGAGNTLATMLATNARVAVNFTAQDFNLFVKGASVGAAIENGAPVPVCETVEATSATLAIAKSAGTPVAPVGYSNIICYVQEVGAASLVENDGVAYTLDADTGVVNGFAATSGKTYKVNYFVSRANAQIATLTGDMNGRVLHFTSEHDIYVNVDPTNKSGTYWGKLYTIVPLLKLTPEGAGIEGDQTANTTTGIIGQALMYDDEVVTDDCADCGSAASPLAYYIVVPCDAASGIEGLALIGGVIEVPQGGSVQANFKLVLRGNNLAPVDNAMMSYSMTTPITGVTVSDNGVITASESASGDGELVGTYTIGGDSYSCPVNVTVVA